MKNAFTSKINDYPIPKSLQKPLNVRLYDETKYPDDHFKTMVTLLSFGNATPVKRLFVLT